MNKQTELYSLISGVIFLISGIAKAIDISVFAQAITQYGFNNLQFLAPIIIMAEVAFGLLLIFQLWQKQTAFCAAIVVTIFTIIYFYGLVFKGVENCGCFGEITVLNTSPIVTFVRNAVLLFLLITVWRKGENNNTVNTWIAFTMVFVMCLIAFMSGYTFRTIGKAQNQTAYKAQALSNTALKDFVTTSKDSTYLVFAFSYTCPHCLNSIANLKEYEQAGVVDRVLGLALGDSIIEKEFSEIFKPNFTIRNHSKELLQLTNSFPKAFFIRNDSIVKEIAGQLPCAFLF